jgi:DNA-binding response OmpR family regulator
MFKKITLVEDDKDSLIILNKVLSDAGYHVNTMAEGRSIIEDNFSVPDIFILDNFMPMIHGIALCKFLKLQAKTKSIPVIIISANKQLKQNASEAGAASFLGKPFHTRELLSAIDSVFSAQ